MWENFKYYLDCLSDLLFPRGCVCCGNILSRHEEFICLSCLKDLPRTYFEIDSDNRMSRAFNLSIQKFLPLGEPFAYAIALFYYRDDSPYRDITRKLKYSGHLSMGRHFSNMLALQIQKATFLSDADLVIPVPLHWTRLRTRGYNQASVIAESIAGVLGIQMRTDILTRVKRTRTQTILDTESKQENVKEAFGVNDAAVRTLKNALGGNPRHILLVDDVFTTGATMAQCHHALRQAFPPNVRISAVTLAFVDKNA